MNYEDRKIEENDRSDGKKGRSCKQLLDNRKEKRGHWELKAETLDPTLWTTGFGRGY
jgi:hypothetical protein